MMKPRYTLALAGAAAGLFALLASAFTVSQTEQALVLQFGKPIRMVQEPGLSFRVPFLENVEYYDRRLLDFDAETKEVISADQKRLIVDAFVRYRITDALRFKQAVGDERAMRSRLNAILESSLRQVIGTVSLSEAISEKRASTMHRIRELVNAQAKGAQLDESGRIVEGDGSGGFGIDVVDVRIVRADLPQINAERVYSRMQSVFEQSSKQFRAKGAEEAQKTRSQADKERTILLAEAKQKAETLRGEGDAEAIKIFAAATGQDPEFYGFWRAMQAYRKSVSPQDTTMVLSPGSEFLKYMDGR